MDGPKQSLLRVRLRLTARRRGADSDATGGAVGPGGRKRRMEAPVLNSAAKLQRREIGGRQLAARGVGGSEHYGLSVREFSCHELNANLLWPGTFSFATWLVKNQSILDGRRVLELGSGTGALAIFLRKAFEVDITTSDYDDKEIEENIAYNCRANTLDVLPHIRHTWGDAFPVSRPDWDIVIASDILLYVKQYDNLIKTVSFLLSEYKQNGHKADSITITNKSGTQVPAKLHVFLMSWRRRIGNDQSLFFDGCEKAGMEVGTLPCLLLIPGLFFIPESPRWLARMNRMDDCETSLQVLRGFAALQKLMI